MRLVNLDLGSMEEDLGCPAIWQVSMYIRRPVKDCGEGVISVDALAGFVYYCQGQGAIS